jgi:hypothetical protein
MDADADGVSTIVEMMEEEGVTFKVSSILWCIIRCRRAFIAPGTLT